VRLNLAILAFGVVVFAAFVVLARRPQLVRIEFAEGGMVTVDGRTGAMPHWLRVDPDARVRLSIVNRDTAWRAVGVLAVPPGDSALYTPDQCMPARRATDQIPLR
jgi:hypothetical protein